MTAAPPGQLSPISAEVLSVAEQLERSERLPPHDRGAILDKQLAALLDHARLRSPFWHERLPPAESQIPFIDLPVLTREHLQHQGPGLRCREDAHPRRARTSGSTGRPVEVTRDEPRYSILYAAQHLRYHAWHGLDADRDMLTILDTQEEPGEAGWGHVMREMGLAGRAIRRNMMAHPPEALLGWLRGQEAPYLTTTASMALQLSRLALERPGGARPLDAVLTLGEVVRPEHRDAVRAAFGARIIDCYSCEEAGWLAFQCPAHEHYHSLASTVHVEIVGDDNRPVGPGEEGRVLVTDLYNFAMPLIRYDIGDRAIAGAPCDCGITLPVIAEILGRERSFIILPDGSRRIARLTGEYWREIAPVLEYRVVQYPDTSLDAFVRAERPLTAGERSAMEDMLRRVLHPGLSVRVIQVGRIAWESRWKRIDVVRTDRPREEQP